MIALWHIYMITYYSNEHCKSAQVSIKESKVVNSTVESGDHNGTQTNMYSTCIHNDETFAILQLAYKVMTLSNSKVTTKNLLTILGTVSRLLVAD